jgi:hypothetical protein
MTKSLLILQPSFNLDDVQVASPCPANWDDMVGSDKVRFCASCQKNVFNLSGMKRDEAIQLVQATEGRICVRFFRRADGTMLTEDCPVGVQAALRRAKRMTYAAAAVSLGAVAALLAVLGGGLTRRTCQRIDEVKTTIEQQIEPEPMPLMGAPPPPPPTMGEAVPVEPVKEDLPEMVMGKIAAPVEMKGDLVVPPPKPHKAVRR